MLIAKSFSLQAQTLSGPNPTLAGSTQTYYASGCAVSPNWQKSNCVLVSQTCSSITVTWSSTATSGGLSLTDQSNGTFMGAISVTLTQPLPPPPAPVANPASNVGSTSFTANWGSVGGASGYSLDVSTGNDFATIVSNFSVSSTSQLVTGLTPGTTYYYRVRDYSNTSGLSSANSNIISLTTILTAPYAPTLAPATSVNGTSFVANWVASATATSYELDVSVPGQSDFSLTLPGYNKRPVSGTSETVSGLGAGATYYYRVRAINSAGTSPNSTTGSVTTPVLPPGAPSASQATSITPSSFVANWSAVPNASNVYLYVASDISFTSILTNYNGKDVSNSTNQTVTDLTGTVYYYRLRAANSAGYSPYSSVITVSLVPPAPGTLSASSITSSSFVANWTSVSGADSYRLDVSTRSDCMGNFVTGYSDRIVNSTSELVTGLSPATPYYYKMRAVSNSRGTSASSNIVNTATYPLIPTANPATDINTTSFTANWSSVTGATGYQLDVSADNFTSFVSTYVNLAGTSQSITGLTPATPYAYRVRSEIRNSGFVSWVSGNSSIIYVTTTQLPPPPIPVAQAASGITSNSFIANWGAVTGAASYQIDVSTNSSFSSGTVTTYTSTSTSYTVTNLLRKPYFYRVRALNSASLSSGNSNTIMISLDYNYIKTTAVQKQGITTQGQLDGAAVVDATVGYAFVDGLGRSSQKVSQKASPNQSDIVQPIVYDPIGRENIKYLPYASGNDGWYKADFVPKDNANYNTSPQYQFYQNASKVAVDAAPYSETVFEPTPLNRPQQDFGPGQSWKTNNKYIGHNYSFNQNTEVILFTYDPATGLVSAISNAQIQYYNASQLHINRTTDEQQNDVVEYVDKLGHLVCKKVQYGSDASGKLYAMTYYIYNDFGDLVVVLPPEAVAKLLN